MISICLLIAVLLGLGLFFGWRQIWTWRTLEERAGSNPSEAAFLWRQVIRRLLCSLLMILFAVFLVGWIFLAQQLADLGPLDPDEVREHPMVRTITLYWIGGLVLLFGLLSLACFDLIATARHGFRSARRLESQRRAELEEELREYRRRRAEMN